MTPKPSLSMWRALSSGRNPSDCTGLWYNWTKYVDEPITDAELGTLRDLLTSPWIFIVVLFTVTTVFPTKAHAVSCSWEDNSGAFHMTDDRSKAPKQATCKDTAEQPVIIRTRNTDEQTSYKQNSDTGNNGFTLFEIRLTESAPPPLGLKPTDADLANAIFWVLGNKLGLPLPSSTTAYVYTDKSSFIDGLIQIGGETSEMATKKVNTFAAFTARKGLLLRRDLLARMSLNLRAKIFAHELTHISQYQLGVGGRRWPAQWLREGHADWVAYQTLDSMGLRTFNESRAMVVHAIKTSPTTVHSFPDLDALANMGKWVDSKKQLGEQATYGQSFLAVEWLIERYGQAKLLEYFRRYATDKIPGRTWQSVYPISYRQFKDEFRNSLESL